VAALLVVTGADDPRVAGFRLSERALTPRSTRRQHGPGGWFAAEGDLVVERALAAGCRPIALLTDDRRPAPVAERLAPAVPVYAAPEAVRRAITGLGVSLDVVGLFERPPVRAATEVVAGARRLVVLEAVDNPTNVGAVVRSAAAMGADALLLDRGSADPLARRALRVSMGAAFALPHARIDDLAGGLAQLHGAGIRTVALTPDPTADDLERVAECLGDGPVAVLLGAERTGLSAEVRAAAHLRARIPMAAGIDSLNVAAAAAVACYVLFTGRPHRR
jgi:tRNA G18 (ribose-2'-O)-methylase SpoU